MSEAGAAVPSGTPHCEVTGVNEPLPASNHRYGAFTDAVVAIAMTLLTLPLMESVAGHPERVTGIGFIISQASQLRSFAISFVLIGMFWFLHHRSFREDTPYSMPMALVNFGWMIAIVFLPVATAVQGAASATDRGAIVLYDSTLAVAAWLLFVLTEQQRRARRAASLPSPNLSIIAAPLSLAILFTLIVGLGIVVPQLGYFPLFFMVLTGPLRALLVKLGIREEPRHDPLATPAVGG